MLGEEFLPGWRVACYREAVDGPRTFVVTPQPDDVTLISRRSTRASTGG